MTLEPGSVRSATTMEELLAHAGFLQHLARELVGDGAADLVQETYRVALEHPPRPGGALRGWLATVAANLARNLRRAEHRRTAREELAARPERLEPDELALERLEIQRTLVELVLALPAEQRTVLHLRYSEGRTPREIAAHLGVPVKTIKTRHTRALAALRERLDVRSHGDRTVWVSALVPLIREKGTSDSWRKFAVANSVAKRLLIGVAVVIVAWVTWVTTRSKVQESVRLASAEAAEEALDGSSRVQLAPPAAKAAREETRQGTSEALQATGALEARFSWSDGTPAVDVWVFARCRNDPAPREESFVERTDATGLAQFAALFPGPIELTTDRGGQLVQDVEDPNLTIEQDYSAQVAAGETSTVECALALGFDIDGSVVDQEGQPVAQAEIWIDVWMLSETTSWAMHKPTTYSAADGSFHLRDLREGATLRALARGHRASWFEVVNRDLVVGPTGALTTTLELGPPGGRVHGRVLDPGGRPIGGAVVLCGSDDDSGSSWPLPIATAEDGSFEVPGDLTPGVVHVIAGARGFPYKHGEVEVGEGTNAYVEIQLEEPATIEGRAMTPDGKPVAGLIVQVGDEPEDEWSFLYPPALSTTDQEGNFELGWVASGQRRVMAEQPFEPARPPVGKAHGVVTCRAGETSTCELTLDLGLILSGRVVDQEGSALAGWLVWDGSQSDEWFFESPSVTDEDGRFLFTNVRNRVHTLRVTAFDDPGVTPARAQLAGVQPGSTELVIVADPDLRRGVVRGVFVDSTGLVPKDAVLEFSAEGSNTATELEFDPQSGAFQREALPWRYTITGTRAHATLLSKSFEIASGEVLDLGTLAPSPPGWVEVVLRGARAEDTEEPGIFLEGEADLTGNLELREGIWHSAELLPGKYALRTTRDDIYLRLLDILVLSGETIRVERTIEPGFTVELVAINRNEDGLAIEARGDDGSVLEEFHDDPSYIAGRAPMSVTLPAGRATIRIRSNTGLEGVATVDAGPALIGAPPIVIELR